MSLLSGSVSLSRFYVLRRPALPDFDQARFESIDRESEERLSCGFSPFRLGADYRIGAERWAFRIRIDRLRPDATRIRERVGELVRDELEEGAEVVGPTKRRELRHQATEEIVAVTSPSTAILECCLDDDVLYVSSTAATRLGIVADQLRRIGVEIAPKVPWNRRDDEFESPVTVTPEEPGSSIGGRMMEELVGDTVLNIEPDDGRVKLRTRDTQIALRGVVIHDLLYFLEHGAEIVAAKMVTEEATFDFDVQSFRITNMSIAADPSDDWQQQLNRRFETISEVFEILDMKFYELSH
ncbi:MAG: hypothetical protein V3T72_03895 [Thermoanaerobaculia bacterium]